jgi:hypothetical protein
MIGYMTHEKAQEVALALSQNLISFHKGRRSSARTPMNGRILRFSVKSLFILLHQMIQ